METLLLTITHRFIQYKLFVPIKYGKHRYRLFQLIQYQEIQMEQVLAQKVAKLKKKDNGTKINIQRQRFQEHKSNPIADQLMSQVRSSLIATRQAFQKSLAKIQDKNLVKQLRLQHKVQNLMLLNKVKLACQKLKVPNACTPPLKPRQQEPEDKTESHNNLQLHYQDIESFIKSSQRQFYCEQENDPSSMLSNSAQTQSQIRQRCKRDNLYPKDCRLDGFRKIHFKQHYSNLFDKLIQHFNLLTQWLIRHQQELQYTIKHKKIVELPTEYKQCSIEWLNKYHTFFLVIMQKGYQQDQTFNIKKYLSTHPQISPLDYLIQISNGLNQLIQHEIYHIDVYSPNIIPVQQDGLKFKFIDFQYAVYLGNQDPRLAANVTAIWKLIKNYWGKDKSHYSIVYSLFQSLLCPQCQFDELKEIELLPSSGLFDLIAEDEAYFIEYLKRYSKLYYRNSLYSIYKELLPQHHQLQLYSQSIESILKYTKQFDQISLRLILLNRNQ